MSKYRIAVGYSSWRKWGGPAIVMLVFIASMVSMPEAIWSWVSPYATVFLFPGLLAILIYQQSARFSQGPRHLQEVYTLSDDGQLRLVAEAEKLTYASAACLHHTSKLLPWGLTLNVERTARYWYEPRYQHVRWVLKGECSEADYCRLCRAIIRVQGATKQGIL